MGVEERYKKRKEDKKTNTLYNGVENRYLSKNIETVGKEISNRVNTWLANNNNYFSNAQSRFSGKSTKYRSDASDWLTTVTTQRENFQKEAESIKATLSQYKDFFGEEYVNSVYKALDGNLKAQEDIINASSKDLEYWSQWESEDEYNTAYRIYGYQQKYTGKGYNDIISALNGLEDGEEKEWLNSNKYGLLKNAADFADNSKYVSTYRGGEKFNYLSGMYTDTGYDDIMYDYINRDEKAINRQLVADVQTNAALLGLDKSERGEMTDDEISIFNYLYATQGSDVAYEYIDYLTSDLNARQRETQEAKWAEYAKKSPVASSVFSVIESPLKGLSYIGQLTDYIDDGKIDQNAGYNKFSYINSAIRDEVTKTVEANWGGVGSFAYQTGMSMGDFLFSTAVSGGNSAISLAIMGTGAAADTVIASKDMGLSDNQAFLLGTAAGAIEVATEKIGIDALFNVKALQGSAGKYILKNFLAEGLEEGFSNLGNTAAEVIDLILSGDESKIKREIYAIMQEQNIDEGAATGKYALGKFKELGLDVLGGAISGGIMGGGGAVIGAIGNTIQGAEMQKNYGAEIGSALTTEALEIDPNNSFAQKMQTKLDGGKNLSNRQIGKLVQQNETAMYENDVTAIQSAAESRLMELGEKGDVKAIAAALTKQAQGERLTFTERERIKSSTYGQRVANELNTENIKTGGYSSSWAERIGTDRINAEEYGRLIQEMEADTVAEPAKVEAPAKVVKEAETAEVTPLAVDVTDNDSVATQDNVTEAKAETVIENTAAKENAVESEISASDEVVNTEGETVTLESASKKYGAQAGAMISTYTEGQDVAKYDAAYQAAYDMGKSGVNLSYAMQSEATAYLTESQRELAHAAGADASTVTATAQDEANKAKANGKTGRRKGVVKGEGVSISDLKKTFNDTQNTAYKLLSTYAEATGIDIVLFKSEANADGKFEGAQGKFKHSEDTIYIDINAGLADIKDVNRLAKYTMMRTFSHEFCHFIEKWNPIWYNEFRKVVFDTLTERGEKVDILISSKMDRTEGMDYDAASREVVAEAMTDILPDANFVEELATKHKNIFEQLLAKLKEFVAELKAYFNSIGYNPSREANALKEQIGESVKYVENIVKLFDKVAVEAVENYQMTVAFEEKAEKVVTTDTKKSEKIDTKPAEVETKEEIAEENKAIEEPVAASETTKAGTASEKLAAKLLDGYINIKNLVTEDGKVLTSKDLYALADEAFGGTQAEGAYNRKDAYDAMELAVNKFLLNYAAIQTRFNNLNGNAKQAASAVKRLEHLLELLPTQNVRTQEMEDFQQFSTPPNIAYLAAWAANITNSDFVLEPSAGIGGLAVFAKAWGAEVAVNELSKRRLEVLRSMGFDHLFNENAEHIDDILPDSISPSVVIMNPPFSSTAGRTANNKTSNAEKHIDQALARLRDGGRLVAVLGKSMNNNDYYKYWDKLRKSVSIRANLSIDGDNYKKYGTTWGVQIVVIDKTGPQTGETVTGRFTDLTEVPNVLEGIRNDRSNVEENRPASRDNGIGKSVADGGNRQSDTRDERSGERSSQGATDSQRTENRKSADGNQRVGDRADRKGVTEDSSPQTERQDGGTDREAGRTDTRNGDSAVESDISDRHQPEQSLSGLNDTEQVSDDGVYATFVAPEIPVTGGKKHPAVLVESAAMAAVSMPKATYKVKLPANVINNNLSDAQLVTVTYAGQAHEQKLADGRRKGFFIGDGTGVGKGRQIAGIILDNFVQGRNKAVWISKNNDLYGDAIRDWTATTGRSKDEVINHNKIKSKDKISIKEGILYSTYDTLKSEKGGNRLEQIVEWLGEDFDGVIAFDEAHNMGNLFGKKGKFGKSKGSEKARAGVELQRRLPNARIVYVSATAATEVDNLAYAERIGLWGQGTAFTNAQDFISKIGSSGLAAMELVIRDMKAMGTYVARSISYNGVNYDTVEHALDSMQTEIYNTMSRAWQKTMSNVQSALEKTGGRYNSTERQRALGNFYSGMQRFYNQVLTSMSMPSVIADMRRELDAGHSCVLQIVNTNEAQQNKQLAEAKANGESLDNLDLTPREALLGYLMNSFPVQMFEEYTDDDGNLRSRPVIDSAGNPVQSKEAIKQRDALVAEVNQMSIPDGPLEMLFDAFGPDMVAENTGRSRRVVPRKKADGTISRVEERRTLNHRTADVQAFQDGKKRILVFSDAGGTGKSYHADRTEKNQQLRIHYVLQPGWVASNAVQGFGRTHRSNEASAPIYKLVTTNIKGQKRFTSTIARRLDQLGALTKGQRDTGSGMFGAKDNLETDLAKDSLREFYRRLGKNQIEGVNGMKTLDRLGLKEKFTDEYGGFKLNDNISRDISTFLNRILALEVDEQNIVFDAFISIYEMELEAAIQSGTLDTGMENVKADKIEVVDDKVIRKDDNTGSETHYIQAKTYTKPKVVTTVEEMSKKRSGFVGIYKTDTDAIKAVFRIADKTTEWGAIQKQYRLIGPNLGAKTTVWNENTLTSKAKEIDKAEWQKEWDTEVAKVPEYNEDTLHMLTGALLPIWNSLPQEGNTRVKRLITDNGDAYLGRVIDKDLIDGVLGRFDIDRTKEVFTAQQVMDKAIDNGVRFYLTNNRAEIFRSRVSGEWRLEITQPYNTWYLTRTYPGIMQERIQYRDRYFIPVGEKGIAILEKILTDNPVRSTADDTVQEQSREYLGDGDDFAEGITIGRRAAGTNYNLSVRDYSLREITNLYAQHVLEPEYDAIFDRVFAFCEDANISYSVVPVIYNNEGKKVPGKSRGDKILLSAEYFNRSDISDQEKSRLILHEMLHTATTYAMNAYESATKKGVTADLSKNIYNSCKQIDKVYDAIKNNPRFEKQYGIKNAREMIAELSNPEFVDRLKSSYPSAWHHLLSAICEIFGINKSFTNYDKLTKAVDEILTHPDYQLAKDYYSFVKGNTHYLDESQYADVQEQQRTNTLTDREILAMAAATLEAEDDILKASDKPKATVMTDAERDALLIFKKRLAKLESLQDERAEQGRLYKEQQFTAPVDRKAAEETRNRMAVLDEQIKKAEADVLSLEDKKVFGEVLKKAKKVVEVEQKKHDNEVFKRHIDRAKNAAAIKKYRERIRKDVSDLYNWITKPNNKDITKHVPDVLKNSVIPFLASIDFTSKQQLRGDDATKADTEFAERLKKLQNALREEISVDDLYSGYIDLPANFMSVLNGLVKSVDTLVKAKSGEFVINKMTSEELKDLSSVIRILKTSITKINQFHANAMYSHVWEAGDNSIDALSVMSSNDGKANAASNFVFWQQIRPAFAFERFGDGGKAIYDGLRRGQAQLAFNTQKIVEFTEKAYTDKEVKAWEKEIKTIKLTAGTVKMRVSDIMSFYELSKQPDSMRHMLGEGMRVATYTLDGKKISDNGHILTELDIATIVNELSQRQKDVADAMQKFMQEQGGAWGNYVSVARFGEELFTNDHYFPINSDGRHLQSTADEHPSNASLYALLNMSFTKARNEKANNRIVVYSIFDVFANHMASMAQYNAMALPVLDAIKWFNYQQKTEDADGNRYVKNSVREQMDRVYGVPEETRPGKGRSGYAQSFVLNILKAFNGTEAQGSQFDGPFLKALRRYNMAQIAYNFRVVVQQPLAITRAALLIDYGSIMKGMKLTPAAIKQNVEEMRKYSGIAAWKSLGFYDVNISRGLTDTIKHSSTVMQNIGEFGMKGAEYADTLTWAAMWSACKEQVIKKQKLTPKDAGFYEAVTKLFEDVIYKTQVVDSILTKNEYMRDKGFGVRMISSFMSEPVTTASMLIDAVDKYNADMKRGMNRQQAWEKNKRMIGRTMYVYAVSAVILAAVQAVADALRDDDDYETFIEKWWEAFWGKKLIDGNVFDELNPLNKLPLVADAYEFIESALSPFLKYLGVDIYSTVQKTTIGQITEYTAKAAEIIADKMFGEETRYTDYAIVYKLFQAVSGATGLPMAATTREIITAWNNIVGAMAPSLKVKSYDPGEQNDIKYAYQDGYLTDEEAMDLLLEKGLVDNEDEAYFTVSGWEAGDGYSRFGSLDTALRSGVGFEEAMNELISHGYTEDDIHSRVRTKASEWYKGGEISRAQAESMLEKYAAMTSDEITKMVNIWSAVVVTGIEYDDIDDEYLAGNITADRAKAMYMRYGGMTEEGAVNKVTVLEFVKEHPECEGITAAAVADYTEYCEPQGIDAKIFYDVWKFKNEATTDRDERGEIILAEKDKVLNYIDSLDLSRKQKDAIYYAFGWAKSTIKDAPWR